MVTRKAAETSACAAPVASPVRLVSGTGGLHVSRIDQAGRVRALGLGHAARRAAAERPVGAGAVRCRARAAGQGLVDLPAHFGLADRLRREQHAHRHAARLPVRPGGVRGDRARRRVVERPAQREGDGAPGAAEVRVVLHVDDGVVGESGAHHRSMGAQCAAGTPAVSGFGVPTNSAPTIVAIDRQAATMNAAWIPPAIASTWAVPDPSSAAERTLNTLTSRATPAAPASCCVAPNTALPYE